MKVIKVLGTGCSKCRLTAALIEQVAAEASAQIQLEKVEDLREIMSYRVLSTPGVVVDGKVVHAGGVPSRALVLTWLK